MPLYHFGLRSPKEYFEFRMVIPESNILDLRYMRIGIRYQGEKYMMIQKKATTYYMDRLLK